MRRTAWSTLAAALPLSLFLLLVATSPAAAAVATSADPSPPSSGLLLAFDATTDDGYDWRHGRATAIAVGQTFRLGNPGEELELDAVTVRITAETPVGNEVVSLVLGTFSDPADATMNELVAMETGTLPAALDTVEVPLYVTFDLPDVTLEGGRQYGFLLVFEGGGAVNDNRARVHHLGEDGYAGGTAFQEEGAFSEPLPFDLVFFLHGRLAGGDVLFLHDGRFEVTARWHTPQGTDGVGWPVPLTEDAGYFWFFLPDNVEVVLKVLNACVEPFDRFWVFAAGLTHVEVTLTVTDTWADQEWVHVNPLGSAFLPVQDTDAFDTCGIGSPQ